MWNTHTKHEAHVCRVLHVLYLQKMGTNVTVFMVWRQSKGAIARWRVGADMSGREWTIAGERERM